MRAVRGMVRYERRSRRGAVQIEYVVLAGMVATVAFLFAALPDAVGASLVSAGANMDRDGVTARDDDGSVPPDGPDAGEPDPGGGDGSEDPPSEDGDEDEACEGSLLTVSADVAAQIQDVAAAAGLCVAVDRDLSIHTEAEAALITALLEAAAEAEADVDLLNGLIADAGLDVLTRPGTWGSDPWSP